MANLAHDLVRAKSYAWPSSLHTSQRTAAGSWCACTSAFIPRYRCLCTRMCSYSLSCNTVSSRLLTGRKAENTHQKGMLIFWPAAQSRVLLHAVSAPNMPLMQESACGAFAAGQRAVWVMSWMRIQDDHSTYTRGSRLTSGRQRMEMCNRPRLQPRGKGHVMNLSSTTCPSCLIRTSAGTLPRQDVALGCISTFQVYLRPEPSRSPCPPASLQKRAG